MSLADTVRSFRQDADLEVCLARCTCQAFRRNVLASVILSRNVTPDNMATSCKDPAHIGPAHVDQKIVNEVLSAATGEIPSRRPRDLKNKHLTHTASVTRIQQVTKRQDRLRPGRLFISLFTSVFTSLFTFLVLAGSNSAL
jgi:hypothetical protein